MSDLEIRVGALDRASATVPVTFTQGDIVHRRAVNAVLKNDGTHDRPATIARVDEVARGVAEKIRIGIIAAPPSPDAK
ncbi:MULTISPECIES: hypothetical protein [unclassified Sphingobium]|uniref:hypothetical protein n=1 Tax=unclassified Sphingobium TaxID=2611147 RepID=UPI002224B270|nr:MULTISPECIES: hypothetical protein [unclassified Sphingobium]MCW2410872.1 hypothetical protein [Sphingobium sp. B8D3D]MCW2416838.1 hypothetical protein [Sphingobium sp. B8D3A]